MPTINEITATDLSSSTYYRGLNPLILKIHSSTKTINKVVLYSINQSALNLNIPFITLYPNSNNELIIDLNTLFKNIMIDVNGKESKSYNINNPNSINVIHTEIDVYTSNNVSTRFFYSLNIVYSYQNTNKVNLSFNTLNLDSYPLSTAQPLNDLNQSYNVPFYEHKDSFLRDCSLLRYNRNNTTSNSYVLDSSLINLENKINFVSNNYIVFRFLNSNGGYSFIAFENYTINSTINVDNSNSFKQYNANQNKTLSINNKFELDNQGVAYTEMDCRFKNFAIEFINSHYVQFRTKDTIEWQDCEVISNNLSDNFNNSFELMYNFKKLNNIK